MKIYISGAFNHRDDLMALAEALAALGHTPTSQWLYEPPLVFGNTEYSAWEYRARANEDMADLRRADAIAFVTLWPSTTGGRHWEAGAAYALDKRMFRIGPLENTFEHLSAIEGFAGVEEFLAFVARGL